MRKLKGITINGEWLGDNVVINANFRAICNIAPFVMQEFAKLVNSINELDSAVAINNFYFPDNNTVDIEFSNKEFEGRANLNFRLNAGVPELVDRKLTIYTDENFDATAIENDVLNEGENLVSDKISADVVKNAVITENIETAQIEEQQDDEVLAGEEIAEDEEILAPIEEVEKNTEVAEVQEIAETAGTPTTDEVDDKEDKIRVDGRVLAQALTEAVKNLPLTNNVEKPNELEKFETQRYNEQSSFNQENIQDFNESIENAIKANENNDGSQISEKQQYCKEENFEPTQSSTTAQTPVAFNDEVEQDISIASETQNDETNSNNSSFDIEENEQEALSQAEQAEVADTQEILVENGEELEEKTKNDVEQEESTTEQEEEIQDCLADFYDNVVPDTNLNDIEVDTSTVQSLLDEITNLKEELSKKEDAKEPTIDEILDSIAKKNNCCNDTYLDFSIMSSDERIDANAVNKELFIAGDKLYKWGETLYLNE